MKECKSEVQIKSLEIFREWSGVLFKIPLREVGLLRDTADCIDNLLHEDLDRLARRRAESNTTIAASNLNENDTIITTMNPRLFDHMTTAVNAWGRIGRTDTAAPENAEALVFKLRRILIGTAGIPVGHKVEDAIRVPDSRIRLHEKLYSALIYCWSQTPSHVAASERALFWFNEMMENSHQQIQKTEVNSKTWNALIRIHVRQRRFHDVGRLVDKYSYLNDGYTYVTLLEWWMKSNSPDGPKRAYQTLQDGIDFCVAKKNFTALQQLLYQYLGQQKNNFDGYSCELVLKQMVALQEENPSWEILTTKHFVVAMNSLLQNLRSDHKSHAADKINELFQSMIYLHEYKVCLQLKPNYNVLVVVLSALAKKLDLQSLEECEALLSKIEDSFKDLDPKVDVIGNHSYNIVLDLYARVPDIRNRKERIEKLLERMKDVAQAHKNSDLLPNRISYSSLIRALQQDGTPTYVSDIERIVLDEMERSPHHSVQPDERIYAMLLDAYYHSNDNRALAWANSLFDRLKWRRNDSVQPDSVMYTLLMKINCKHGNVDGSDKALRTMIRDFERGNAGCRPNEIEFVTAMTSWDRSGRSDAPDGALRLFHEMMAQYENGNEACRPSKKTFGQLMVVLAKSRYKSKKVTADRLLATMNRLGIEPDLMILDFYIYVCATILRPGCTPQDLTTSWEAAYATFRSLRASEWGASSHSYNGMLHACNNLLNDDGDTSPTKRFDAVREIHSFCLEDGKLDERILKTLQRILPPEQYKILTHGDGVGDQPGTVIES